MAHFVCIDSLFAIVFSFTIISAEKWFTGIWIRQNGELLAFEYVKTGVDKRVSKDMSMQHVLEEKSSSYSILIFVISLFGCLPALDARGRRPVRPTLCTPLRGPGWETLW